MFWTLFSTQRFLSVWPDLHLAFYFQNVDWRKVITTITYHLKNYLSVCVLLWPISRVGRSVIFSIHFLWFYTILYGKIISDYFSYIINPWFKITRGNQNFKKCNTPWNKGRSGQKHIFYWSRLSGLYERCWLKTEKAPVSS